MKRICLVIFCLLVALITSGCVTSPIVIDKMKIEKSKHRLPQRVLLVTDREFLSFKHNEKQLGATFEYDLGFYLKNAIHDSLNSVFEAVAQTDTSSMNDKFDLVIKPTVLSFSAPVPALVVMRTQTEVTIRYEVIPQAPLKSYFITSTGTYELLDDQDKKVYNSLTGRDIYTYNAATNFGMAIPNYSYEAGKDAYIAIYHALRDLNSQLIAKLTAN